MTPLQTERVNEQSQQNSIMRADLAEIVSAKLYTKLTPRQGQG